MKPLNKNFKDITGQKFNRFTVIEHSGFYINPNTNRRTSKWKCKCDCGNIKIILGASLKYGSSKSCGCLLKENHYHNYNKLEHGEAAFNILFNNYKYGAKCRNLEFHLNKEEFRIFMKKNCSICGVEPRQKSENRTTNGPFFYNGIDRINNNVGYILNNCRTMCKICNYAKKNLTEEEFQEWLKRIRSYNANE